MLKDYYANVPNISAAKSFTVSHSKSNFSVKVKDIIYLKSFEENHVVQVIIVLCSFVVLASAKECEPGQNCELKCCTTPEGDVVCRKDVWVCHVKLMHIVTGTAV